MALVTPMSQNVERTGNVQQKSFSIQASAEAFRILSDGLYSDKVRAIVRELGTNALDAHIEAKNASPFHVELPKQEKPWFKIRDFGTGLAHDDVMNLYSTYFGSTKTDNPNVVGQLGLGSKSPLSYTRSFTVTSYVAGVKNQYVVMLDEDRIPQVNFLPDQSGPTNEPNGLEVQIAVRQSDFQEFATKAADVYKHFATLPTVTGNDNFKIPTRKIILQGKGWRIYDGLGNGKAIMGSIAYPIQGDKIHDVTAHHKVMLNCNIEIDFPIGALEFTPSRESLSYKKSVSETLRTRLDEIVSEVNAIIGQKFVAARSLWEARVLAHSIFWEADSTMAQFQKLADASKITYQGKEIHNQHLQFEQDGIEAYSFSHHKKYRHRWSTDSKDLVNQSIKRSTRNYFIPRGDIMWCEVDIPRGSFSRCQDVVARGDAKEVYLVSFSTAEVRAKFCEKMGLLGDELVKTSSLPKPAVVRGVFHQSTSQVFKHTGSTNEYRMYRYWKEVTAEIEDGGVYVEMRRNQAFVNGKTIDPGVIGQIIKNLKAVGHVVEVIGVRPTVAKEFRKSDDWVDIFTYAKNVLRTEMVSNELGKNIANVNELDHVSHSDVMKRIMTTLDKLTIANDSPLMVFINKIKALKASELLVKSRNAWKDLAESCEYSLKGMADFSMTKESDVIRSTYPMMDALFNEMGSYSINDGILKILSDYVNLVDGR